MDPEKKSLNFIFPTKYVIPKSLSRLAIGQVRKRVIHTKVSQIAPYHPKKRHLSIRPRPHPATPGGWCFDFRIPSS